MSNIVEEQWRRFHLLGGGVKPRKFPTSLFKIMHVHSVHGLALVPVSQRQTSAWVR